MRLLNSIGAKPTACFDLVLVEQQLSAAVLYLLVHPFGHQEELVEVHCALVLEVLFDFVFGLVEGCEFSDFVEVDQSIGGLIGIEGLFDLEDLALVEALVEVVLYWKARGHCQGVFVF
jgi:hypothetical protein